MRRRVALLCPLDECCLCQRRSTTWRSPFFPRSGKFPRSSSLKKYYVCNFWPNSWPSERTFFLFLRRMMSQEFPVLCDDFERYLACLLFAFQLRKSAVEATGSEHYFAKSRSKDLNLETLIWKTTMNWRNCWRKIRFRKGLAEIESHQTNSIYWLKQLGNWFT